MLLVVCQLSRDVIGYRLLNFIGAFQSVLLSELNSHFLLVELSVISHSVVVSFV